MRYIFYTTDGLTEDINNKEIENSQILGFAEGNNIKEAYNNFLLDYDYLKDNKYNNILALEVKGMQTQI